MLEIIAFLAGHITGFVEADENTDMSALSAAALASGILGMVLTGLLGFGTTTGVYELGFLFADVSTTTGLAMGAVLSFVTATVGTYVGYASNLVIDDLQAAINKQL